MIKGKSGITSEDPNIQLQLLGTVLAMRSVVEQLDSKLNKQPLAEVQADFDKKVMAEMQSLKSRGTAAHSVDKVQA